MGSTCQLWTSQCPAQVPAVSGIVGALVTGMLAFHSRSSFRTHGYPTFWRSWGALGRQLNRYISHAVSAIADDTWQVLACMASDKDIVDSATRDLRRTPDYGDVLDIFQDTRRRVFAHGFLRVFATRCAQGSFSIFTFAVIIIRSEQWFPAPPVDSLCFRIFSTATSLILGLWLFVIVTPVAIAFIALTLITLMIASHPLASISSSVYLPTYLPSPVTVTRAYGVCADIYRREHMVKTGRAAIALGTSAGFILLLSAQPPLPRWMLTRFGSASAALLALASPVIVEACIMFAIWAGSLAYFICSQFSTSW
ncbi:hypothetical protein EXIGLDRAFT_769015 [Exidia glandulosa HHB12029]|uniref:Uncharacterized protein n=1 Tax=Exidia glandulosa HHB12029 TaxID=1314781 RepID=A0A165HU48_EXIGL|nr:hypothetical protein EXIGLDRAFT_769015 [Exidia glandulosa HHB12029]